MDKITRRAIRGYNYYLAKREAVLDMYRAALADEDGTNEVPGWLIYMLIGVAAAVLIGGAIMAFVNSHVAQLPS